ncbi:hypothetical protein E8A74_42540 [Polyangium fumosum]|uniref:MAM domain-containing protein n=2 Tax=Polyangium fumosum TaxID=889272 RepID=A0A4U1IUK3_9BACT|nr:hypothetical protein E8A74_42540 [Polyangium fumosum]
MGGNGGGGSGGMGGNGGMGGAPPFCMPGSIETCYTGPCGTQNIGACKPGTITCNPDGTAYGPCTGEVTPVPEVCATAADDDCDGQTNEEGADCVCAPGSSEPCYTGPMGTAGLGICMAGTQVCNDLGTAYGPCTGEVTPVAETCATAEDDDCDGQTNEEGAGCVCPPNAVLPCYTGPVGTLGVGLCKAGTAMCNALGTALGDCMGQTLPATETCATPGDDDCDGQTNEGCVCAPGSTQSCYTGPAGTSGVGACKAGTRACNAQGTGYGACTGEIHPQPESCMTAADDDCDGQTNEGCAAQTCAVYQENFDDGNASPLTAGVYKVDWCDDYIPLASNTPACMTGRTLRTNESTIDPTIWVYKGDASCTSVRLNYTYYQYDLANVNVSYQQSNDTIESCEKSGLFTSVTGHNTLKACAAQTQITIPFGSSKGVYIRFDHGTGQNALWLDNLSLEFVGCGC